MRSHPRASAAMWWAQSGDDSLPVAFEQVALIAAAQAQRAAAAAEARADVGGLRSVLTTARHTRP